MASGSEDYTIKIWDVTIGKLKFNFDETNGGHTDSVVSLESLENGYLASGSDNRTIKIWDITSGKLKFTFDTSNGGHSDLIWYISKWFV